MLIKELKFVREQLAYHRKQLARVDAERNDMKHEMIDLKKRLLQAEGDKTKVMTRSIAEKHMLANEISALEDAFMMTITDKDGSKEQAHAQVMMLRKEVRHLRNQFVSVRQELANERKLFEDETAKHLSEISQLKTLLEQSAQQQQQQQQHVNHITATPIASLSNGAHATHTSNNTSNKTSAAADIDFSFDDFGDDSSDIQRIRKQRDMFERENAAMTKQMSQMKQHIAQLEAELLRLHAADPSAHDALEAISDSLLTSQQDSVKLLKQMLSDARKKNLELKETAECDRVVLGDVIRELDERMSRTVSQNRNLSVAFESQQQRLQEIQGELSQAQIEKLMIENDNPFGLAGRLAKDATTKAFSKLKIIQQ
eukprot:c4651_g1_i1.p1 GENE.c4651_g1_i1~~c4651_g1_i1.p1  ORF type:complete len:424 (+),score=127.65 c4651_g1_i1:165-1274(+)